MEYTTLGFSNIKVSRLCLGGMSFGEASPKFHLWTIGPEDTQAVIKRALDLGINFIDTANTYAIGTSEEYIGRVLSSLDQPIIDRVAELSARCEVPMARIALAWHWARGVEAPIVGCSNPARVDDAIAALEVKLTPEEVSYLEEPYTVHELVGPAARPGDKPLAGTVSPHMTK